MEWLSARIYLIGLVNWDEQTTDLYRYFLWFLEYYVYSKLKMSENCRFRISQEKCQNTTENIVKKLPICTWWIFIYLCMASSITQSGDAWLTSLVTSRLVLCNANHIIHVHEYVHTVLFGDSKFFSWDKQSTHLPQDWRPNRKTELQPSFCRNSGLYKELLKWLRFKHKGSGMTIM